MTSLARFFSRQTKPPAARAPAAGQLLPFEQRTVDLNGAQAAIGLDWFTVISAKELAATIDRQVQQEADQGAPIDVKIVRRAGLDGKWQAGLGRKIHGHRPGMPSAASLMAAAYPNNELQSWVSLKGSGPEDAIWILRLSDGAVLDDRYYRTREEALSFFQDLQRGPNTKILATPDLNQSLLIDTDAFPFDTVDARRVPAASKLRRLDQQVRLRRVLLLCLALGVGSYIAWDFASEHFKTLETERQKRERVERIQPPPAPWLGKPSAVQTADACIAAAGIRFLPIPGWQLNDITCGMSSEPFSVRMNFRRLRSGYPLDLEYALQRYFGSAPDLAIDQIASLASVNMLLPGTNTGRAIPPLQQPKRSLELEILDYTSSLGLREGIRFQSVPVPLPPPPSEEVDWPSYPNATQIAVNSRLDLNLWRPVFERPGFVLTSLVRDENTKNWNFTGIIYSPATIVPGRRR